LRRLYCAPGFGWAVVVLSIGKLVVGQQRYYEQQVAHGGDDYYSGRGAARRLASGRARARVRSALTGV